MIQVNTTWMGHTEGMCQLIRYNEMSTPSLLTQSYQRSQGNHWTVKTEGHSTNYREYSLQEHYGPVSQGQMEELFQNKSDPRGTAPVTGHDSELDHLLQRPLWGEVTNFNGSEDTLAGRYQCQFYNLMLSLGYTGQFSSGGYTHWSAWGWQSTVQDSYSQLFPSRIY